MNVYLVYFVGFVDAALIQSYVEVALSSAADDIATNSDPRNDKHGD